MDIQHSFWGNAKNHAVIDLSIQKRLDFIKEISDMPSFSLEFTPTPPDEEDQQPVERCHQEVIANKNDKGKAIALEVEIPTLMQQQFQSSKPGDVEYVKQQQVATTIAQLCSATEPATTTGEQQADVEVEVNAQRLSTSPSMRSKWKLMLKSRWSGC
nr:hypothetical protein Iba_chr14cCG5990 [Ipomoea batatas]